MIAKMKRALSTSLIILLAASSLAIAPVNPVFAEEKTLTLKAAITSALENSTTLEKIDSQIASKKASFDSTVKKTNLKEKNMRTFRWSPLLSFHFPETPNETTAYDFAFKANSIQAEIVKLQHKLVDARIGETEKINNLFVDIYVKMITIDFNKKRLAAAERAYEKNTAKLKLGTATQADVDKQKSSIDSLSSKISADENTLVTLKKKLSQAVGFDVSTGYKFEVPTVEATIDRTQLKPLEEYTLQEDQTYFETTMSAQTGLISLQTNYRLMSNWYGSEMWPINGYVQQAMRGEKVNAKAFRNSYNQFINLIDSHWEGKKRILIFFKIPRLWFKGDLDGSRYIEDDPYVLYQDTLDYQDARLENEATHDEVIEKVDSGFDNYISLRNAYSSAKKQADTAKTAVEKAEKKNVSGEMTYEEYTQELDTLETAQTDMIKALSDYTAQLYSYDRTTCGGISAILYGNGLDIEAAPQGESFVKTEYADGGKYFIKDLIDATQFVLTVTIPDNFPVVLTHFELWADSKQIGERQELTGSIRHLQISKSAVETTKIRFYNEEEFVCDCEIDPTVSSGPLKIPISYSTDETKEPLGSYTVETNPTTSFVTLRFSPIKKTKIQYIRLKTASGKFLVSDELHDVGKPFTYLSFLNMDLEQITIEYYDDSKKLLYEGYFDTQNYKLMRTPEEEEAST